MEADYNGIIQRFTEAGLGTKEETKIFDLDYRPSVVVNVLVRHYLGMEGRGYSVPKAGVQDSGDSCQAQLNRGRGCAIVINATRVGDRTRVDVVDLEQAVAA
jgi:hypothetical protein